MKSIKLKSQSNPLFSVPRIGIGVIVVRDNQVLLLKRKNAHGEGEWNLPGGHLEFGETMKTCIKREVWEETGLKVTESKVISMNEEFFSLKNGDRHYITIGGMATSFEGEPQLKEPEKCELLGWYSFDSLPQPLFKPTANIIKCYLDNRMTLS